MADWKAQINFNYSPSYHAYAYGLMYAQPGAEQTHVNLATWTEPGADLCDNFTPTQGYYTPAAAPAPGGSPEEQSPPQQSPEPHAYHNSGLGQYQNTGLGYLDHTEGGRLHVTGQPGENEGRRAGSDSASDSEPQTSPDSWSSGSSGEGLLPQADPATWAQKTDLDDQTSSNSPDSTEDISSVKEPQAYGLLSNEGGNNTATAENATAIAPMNQGTKGKVRAAFSETQMNILTQRFNVQRYLTPAEMKNMAEITGLTYKQVKTWFQNRRMKLRRHQKDNSWASERYTLNKGGAGAAFTNLPSHMQPYQGHVRPAPKEHYNPHVIEAALKKPTPQDLALYLAAVGGANGSAGYPAWPPNATQSTVHSRPQVPGWPLPPGSAPQFAYNAIFNAQSLSNAPDAGSRRANKSTECLTTLSLYKALLSKDTRAGGCCIHFF
uniref:Nanog homeobox n=1 Tax=Neogobius melanostomus TaxID=47308 RepID=A0A8C6TBX9_9GOBI